ncbi:retrovirus-related pol polyprotein from transposon TNT 1-94 [Tanacetum coccineum]
MMASSPICLLSKASKTKSWLWHRRLSYLNFGAINHLARHGLVRGLPKLKFEKDHLCSACAMGKSKKKPHKPKSEDTNQEKLYLLHMDLCGPMCVASVNGKKYILVIVDDYSRFTWGLRSSCYRMLHPKLFHHTPSDNEQKHHYDLYKTKPPDLSFSTYIVHSNYPTNDSENLGKLQPKADIDFDELTTMASEHSSSGPALHEITPATISSGLVPNPPPSTPFVPPSRTDWDILFQPMFDELLTPPPSVDLPAPEVIAPIDEVVAPVPAVSTRSPSSTTVDHECTITNYMSKLFSVTTMLSSLLLNPRRIKALTQSSWIEAVQEELNEFERLEVWELVPRPDKVMVITLKWIYKVKLDEHGSILKNRLYYGSWLPTRREIDFESPFSS